MTDRSLFTPPGWHTVVPRVVVDDPEGLVGFVVNVFDAEGSYNEQRPSEVRIGDSLVMISAAAQREKMPAFLYVYVADTDAIYERALAAGATTLEEPAEMPYGDRRAMIEDPFGITWQIATHRKFTV